MLIESRRQGNSVAYIQIVYGVLDAGVYFFQKGIRHCPRVFTWLHLPAVVYEYKSVSIFRFCARYGVPCDR